MRPKSITSVLPLDKSEEVFDKWYTDVCYFGGLVEYYPTEGCYAEGCYALLDTPMQIWDRLKDFLNSEMKLMNVKKCHFPLISKEHAEADLKKAVYPYFSKWIKSPSDLPMKLNQWCNAARPELSNPTPFLRCREFMWQEGHGAFATQKEAHAEHIKILEMYQQLYEDFLAVPVMVGRKSENEKLLSGLYSTCAQVFIPETGHGVEGASSHCLGQTFAKSFNISYEEEKGRNAMVWQTSWEFSTAAIGLMVMIHGDDKGLVLPPRVAPVQIVVIPVICQGARAKSISDACVDTASLLERSSFRVEVDQLGDIPLSMKQLQWERKGVPLRVLIGAEELDSNTVVIVRRDGGTSRSVSRDNLADQIHLILNQVHDNLLKNAVKKRDSCVQEIENWAQFEDALKKRRLVLAPWCEEAEVEQQIRERTEGLAKNFGTPFSQPPMDPGTLCFASGKLAKSWSYWTRSH